MVFGSLGYEFLVAALLHCLALKIGAMSDRGLVIDIITEPPVGNATDHRQRVLLNSISRQTMATGDLNPAGGGPTSHLPPGEGGHKVAPLLSQLLHEQETPNLAGG